MGHATVRTLLALGSIALLLLGAACRTAGPDPAAAWTLCKQGAIDRLKAPATAVFPAFDPAMLTTTGGGYYTLASYVDSQNGFGALLRSRFSCDLRWTGSAWSLAGVSFEGEPTPTPLPGPTRTPTPDATAAAGVVLRADPGPYARGAVYPAGTRFELELAQSDGWLLVMAPDGAKGWIKDGDPHAVIVRPG